MGIVSKARHRVLGGVFALKMILSGAHAGSAEVARIRREAAVVARLRHPNVVQIYEIGEVVGRPFLALEYVAGGRLAQHLGGWPCGCRCSPAPRWTRTVSSASWTPTPGTSATGSWTGWAVSRFRDGRRPPPR
jgi:serine/threonine-protein kinase